LAACAEALPVQRKHLLLEAGQAHRGGDKKLKSMSG
jgi:hypothetical protein